jgi:hypothetical protein
MSLRSEPLGSTQDPYFENNTISVALASDDSPQNMTSSQIVKRKGRPFKGKINDKVTMEDRVVEKRSIFRALKRMVQKNLMNFVDIYEQEITGNPEEDELREVL